MRGPFPKAQRHPSLPFLDPLQSHVFMTNPQIQSPHLMSYLISKIRKQVCGNLSLSIDKLVQALRFGIFSL